MSFNPAPKPTREIKEKTKCSACRMALAKSFFNAIPVCNKCHDKLTGTGIKSELEKKKPKQKKIKQKSDREYSKALREAKTAFQKLRRAQYADLNGMLKTIDGKIKNWKKCDAGHFISATKLNTCFDPMNVHPQSKMSNYSMGDGLQVQIYRKWLVEKYGESEIQKLEQRSHIRKKYSAIELQAMKMQFKLDFEKVAKEKGLN